MQLRMPNNDELLQHRTRQSLSNQKIHTTLFTNERTHNIHNNPFDLLYNESECYICHNYGHKTLECHLKN